MLLNPLFCFNCLNFVGVDRMSLGEGHSLIVKSDGSVWAAGGNHFGQLGTGLRTKFRPHFVEVLSTGAKAVAAGSEYSMVLGQDGSVWATGRNQHGQLGDGSVNDRFSFVWVISSGKALAAGSKHSLVVKEDGSVWAAGCNMHGQLGDGSKVDKMIFAQVILSGVKTVAAGSEHSLVLGEDGSVWAAGANNLGQLGDGSTTEKSSFVRVLSTGAKAVAAGGYLSMLLKEDDTVWAMGDNKSGQLGNISQTSKKVIRPVVVGSMQSVSGSSTKAIAVGFAHSMVLQGDGSVWISGANHLGPMQDGSRRTAQQRTIFTQIVARGVEAIVSGYFHSMMLKDDGSFWAMGVNNKGQLGDGSRFDKNTFVRVARANEHGALWTTRVCSLKRAHLPLLC